MKIAIKIGLSEISIWLFSILIVGLIFYGYSLLFDSPLFFILMPLVGVIMIIFFFIIKIFLLWIKIKMYGLPIEGSFLVESKQAVSWLTERSMVIAVDSISNLVGVPREGLLWVYTKLLKSKLGKNLWVAGCINEPSLTEIGNNTMIGAGALVTAHLVEKDKVILKKIIIGSNCTIGAKSIVMPGAVIGDGAIVGAMSLVPKNAVLEPYSVYVGIPVKKIKSLKP
ncbi:MAG: acyltransferase [Candidatus Nanoarchaeia archaeon]